MSTINMSSPLNVELKNGRHVDNKDEKTEDVHEILSQDQILIEKGTTKGDSIINRDKENENKTSPILCRKRKLSSFIDEDTATNTTETISETKDDTFPSQIKFKKCKSSKSETVKNRRNHTTQPKNNKQNVSTSTMSPKTLKYNKIFDSLKDSIENDEPVLKVNEGHKMEVYNLTTDSEDEDLLKIKDNIDKSNNISRKGRFESNTSHPPLNRVNYSDTKTCSVSKESCNVENNNKQKRAVMKRTKQNKITLSNELEDEQMRECGLEVLNTSLIIENTVDTDMDKERQPHLLMYPQMEMILDDISPSNITNENFEAKQNVIERTKKPITTRNKTIKNKNNHTINKTIFPKKGRKSHTSNANKSILKEMTNNPESPMPNLVVEIESKNIPNESTIFNNMLTKCIAEFLDNSEYDKKDGQQRSPTVDASNNNNESSAIQSKAGNSFLMRENETMNAMEVNLEPASSLSQLVFSLTENSSTSVKDFTYTTEKDLNVNKIKKDSYLPKPSTSGIYNMKTCGVLKSSSHISLTNEDFEESRKSISTETDTVDDVILHSSPESTPSTSKRKVQEWLSKCPDKNTGDSTILDCIERVLEKLAITHENINNDTAKRLAMLVDNNENAFQVMRDEQEQMYKETVKQLMTNIEETINERLMSLFYRLINRYNQVNADFKKQISDIIKEYIMKTGITENIQ